MKSKNSKSKLTSKKPTASKVAVKKPVAKKPIAKPVAKKAVTTKMVTKKPVAKKAEVKKAVIKTEQHNTKKPGEHCTSGDAMFDMLRPYGMSDLVITVLKIIILGAIISLAFSYGGDAVGVVVIGAVPEPSWVVSKLTKVPLRST